ncbi:MAG: MBL fold metallo-hydrolase [Anaerolineales bacterium]
MTQNLVHCLDLNFEGRPQSVASYMFEHSDGVVLVEAGSGSTLEALKAALAAYGYGLRHITHVLLTHIHLDHAGASGYLARQGAQIYVHPVGAPHMINPEKLIASARRVYGERFDALWGEFLPVPPEKLTILQDNEEVVVGKLRFRALNAPGHAEHHYVYQFEDLCLSGDVGAVRIPGYSYVRLPTPPPEFHLEKWYETILRLQKVGFKRIAPTHFGIFDDAARHLEAVLKELDLVDTWMMANMLGDPPVDALRQSFLETMDAQDYTEGLDQTAVDAYRLANTNLVNMSVDGMARYWKKYRADNSHA